MKLFKMYKQKPRTNKDILSLQEIEMRTQLLLHDLERELCIMKEERANLDLVTPIFKI